MTHLSASKKHNSSLSFLDQYRLIKNSNLLEILNTYKFFPSKFFLSKKLSIKSNSSFKSIKIHNFSFKQFRNMQNKVHTLTAEAQNK